MKIGTEPILVTTADGKELDINKYLPLVKYIVYKVSSRLIKSSELYLDLQAAGYVGLIEAAKNYDTTKSAFTTFAYQHIKGRVLRALTHEQEEDHTLDSQKWTSDPSSYSRFLDESPGESGQAKRTVSIVESTSLDYNIETDVHNLLDALTMDTIIEKLFGRDSLEKKIFDLKYKENKVFMEIGKELGIHYKTAETKHKKAITKIRAYILNKNKGRV